MNHGIFTLANDNVYDQLVALLNSIEANYSKDIPVYVIPYDDNIEKLKDELKLRLNVTLFQDADSIAKWEKFAADAWSPMPGVLNLKPKTSNLEPEIWGRHKLGVHRKFCCFDGPFEKFVFMDSDALLMQPVDYIFDKLNTCDFVAYDYQYKDPSHVYNVNSPKLYGIFSRERISSEIFCTGFFASKKGLFDTAKKDKALNGLKSGESEILYPRAPEQSLLNYMVMKNGINIFNFARNLTYEKRTGDAVTAPHFQEQDHILYDRGNRLTYLHYIGIGAQPFRKLCQGQNIGIPYREIFLHYRYLHEPKKCPAFKGKGKPYSQPLGPLERAWLFARRIAQRAWSIGH